MMFQGKWRVWAALIAWTIAAASVAWAAPREIDTARSKCTVYVFRGGLFSFMGDDHQIEAPVMAGNIDDSARAVNLRIGAATLRVLDPKLTEDKRTEVQRRMVGPDVLNVERYPYIDFRSTRVSANGAELEVEGLLTLHGQTHPVTLKVKADDHGGYHGGTSLKQTAFGMKPVTIGGGTVRVKDEVRIEFSVVSR